ncbi:MAG: hypothetical protein A2284_01955 [Deltaproteobacteria bacterium RIFOXYA12_FULL_61_11]|nr:MAG: hypothetical protein A2284_01955 [Deltaproteobacteria bacterium RIFOXYA12_FULL_61_11]
MKRVALTAELIEQIERIPFCAFLDERGRHYLLEKVQVVEIPPNKLLLKKGTFGEELFAILAGEVRVWERLDEEVKEYARLGKDQIFGEMSAIMHTPRSANVSTVTDVVLLVLLKQHIAELLKINPSFREFLGELGLHREQENLDLGF